MDIQGDLRGYKPLKHSHCLQHCCKKKSLVRMSSSWSSAVWILTIRKTLQQWAEVLKLDPHVGDHPWQSVIPTHSTVMLSLPAQVGHGLSGKHAQRRESQKETGQADDSSYFAKHRAREDFFFFSTHSNTIFLFFNSHCDVKVLMSAFSSSSSPRLPYSITHPHRWREDRHLREGLWRHQYHYGCTETVPEGFACSRHLIRCLPKVHRGCK